MPWVTYNANGEITAVYSRRPPVLGSPRPAIETPEWVRPESHRVMPDGTIVRKES